MSSTTVTGPNAGWTYGQRIDSTPEGSAWKEAGEKAGWTVYDTSKEEPSQMYKLMISGIVPRPVAFTSTISEDGIENLAPFSWFNMVTNKPPLVSIVMSNRGDPDIPLKDTCANIKATKQFVVNIISEPFLHQANSTSIDTPPEVSEWELSGLTKAPSVHVKPSRVLESAFSMECELFQWIDIPHPDTGVSTSTMILGHVRYIHVRNDVLIPEGERGAGTVDVAKYKPIARLGDISYAPVGDAIRIARPSWATEAGIIKEALGISGSNVGTEDAQSRI